MDDLKLQVDGRLDESKISSIYSEHLKKIKRQKHGEILGQCPFTENHSGKNTGNFKVNTHTGQYHCYGCEESGNIYTFVKKIVKQEKPLLYLAELLGINHSEKKDIISSEYVEKANKALLEDNEKLSFLIETLNIKQDVINELKIGYVKELDRYTIPVLDHFSNYVNIRKWNPNSKPKIYGIKGKNQDRLYPINKLDHSKIFIFEGEKDCLLALSLGINAITNTGGAKVWPYAYNYKFKGKEVVICMDTDGIGKKQSIKRASSLYPYAKSVKIIDLPLNEDQYPAGDFFDYIVKEGNTLEQFLELEKNSMVFTPEEEDEYKLSLAESEYPKYHNKKCILTNILVCGKEQYKYAGVPHKVLAKCKSPKRGEEKKCESCALANGDQYYEIEKFDKDLLKLLSEQLREKELAKKLDINPVVNCKDICYEHMETYNVHTLIVEPELIETDTTKDEISFTPLKSKIYVVDDRGVDIDTSKLYNFKALSTSDPKDGTSCHIAYDFEECDSLISLNSLTTEDINELKRFQVKDGETIQSKLDDIYKEYSAKSGIYKRNDVFLAMDLSYHSAIGFKFGGKPITKGWVEVAIIGDSGVGKSKIARFLTQYYKLGEIVSGESLTLPGLVAATVKSKDSWMIEWGRLPINDRRLVVIEETSGLSTDEISKMTEIRSQGIAYKTGVTSAKSMARTRIIWISNPRKNNLGIKQFNYGCMVFPDVFGTSEDIRRIDLGLVLMQDDHSDEELKDILLKGQNTTVEDYYTSEISSTMVKFAWAIKSKDIKIEDGVFELVVNKTYELVKLYSNTIPLIEKASSREKIIRMSVALAIRLFNINDNRQVVVTKEHVEYIAEFLNRTYSAKNVNYKRYSKSVDSKEKLKDKLTIFNVLNLDCTETVEDYIDTGNMQSRSKVIAIIKHNSLSMDDIEYTLVKLERANAIKQHKNVIVFTPQLRDFIQVVQEFHDKHSGNKNYENFLKFEDSK